jgi:hypothetical protein
MRQTILILLCIATSNTIMAQLVVTPGGQFHISGNATLTLQNTDLVNNGIFTTGNSKVSFTGNATSFISGSQPVQFYDLEINKTAGNAVVLQRAIDVKQQINFISGLLNLNNFDTDLGSTGFLNGESESSRITGINGGQVLFTTILNNPSSANPANLGAIITSTQNMGTVVIKRGHQSQVNGSGMGNSVLRYYDITPVNNTGLNATLRFHYFDAELNSLNENTLVFWKSPDAINWSNEGFTSRNTSSNYVEKTGIGSFSRWTLSSINNPLPVLFILFNAKCNGNNVLITWKTAQEQNSSHFNIESSTDGIVWTVIGSLPAAGNSNVEQTYSFTDNNPVQKSYYRIAQYDIDTRVQYTSVIKAPCGVSDLLKVWPNPFTATIFVNITANHRSASVIKVYDMKGSLVKIQRTELLQGTNQVNVDMKNLSAGMYNLIIEWNNGQMKRAVQVIKQ